MNIAFYAPLKSPAHPVPSGDRLMARLIIACLNRAGHEVAVVSELRAFLGKADDTQGYARLLQKAEGERARLRHSWQAEGAPDLWFCYHPYYKSPDLIGPPLCAEFALPYVTAEASYSARRNLGIWREMQAALLAAVEQAAVNICLTERDRAGLLAAAPAARFARLKPFIDATAFSQAPPQPDPGRLVCAAMMRPGDKYESYVRLAAALALLPDVPWRLSIIGDGPLRAEVQALFAAFGAGRVEWHGQLGTAAIAEVFARSAIYAWPGCGEAYGLAYLEAQAAGVPVVAYRTAGVPEVVEHGVTGLLTPPQDDASYAAALSCLLGDGDLRHQMALSARARVLRDHAMETASRTLDLILQDIAGRAG